MKRLSLSALAAFVLVACSDSSPTGLDGNPTLSPVGSLTLASTAWVTTDKADYAPGETVTITGGGFWPGEMVSMVLQEEPNVQVNRTLSSVADDSGGFVNTDFAPGEFDVGVTFTLVATGQSSGLTAETVFTDGTITFTSFSFYPGESTSGVGPTGCTGSTGTSVPSGTQICALASFSISGMGSTPVSIRWKRPDGTIAAVNARSSNFANGTSGAQTFSAVFTPTIVGTWTALLCESSGTSTTGANATGCQGIERGSATFAVTSSDNSPPVITPNISGTLGNNGWYVSDVTVTWSVVDNESTISSSTGCGPTTIDADTPGETITCSATSAGGTNSQSVTIKRDATAPMISGSASPSPNGNGWNNTDVTVTFSCSDATAGIASCGPNQTLSSEGSGQSASGTAVDNAGNSNSTTVSGINIDKTAPVVSVTGVSDGATYILGSVPTAGCSTSDALSGVATNASLGVSGGPVVGAFTATCSGATDNAGNSGSASVTYNVVYDWNGFFRPIDNLPIWNVAKAGSAIPVKFSLSGNQGLDIFYAGYPRSVPCACDNSASLDTIEETVNPGGSSLSYDPVADQYVYVWKSDKAWGAKCRQLEVKLIDGTKHVANFKFTK